MKLHCTEATPQSRFLGLFFFLTLNQLHSKSTLSQWSIKLSIKQIGSWVLAICLHVIIWRLSLKAVYFSFWGGRMSCRSYEQPCIMVQWLALSPTAGGFWVRTHQLTGALLCGVCMFSSCLQGSGIFSGYSGFLSQSKDMQVRLIGDSKLPMSVSGCLSLYDWLVTCLGCTPL